VECPQNLVVSADRLRLKQIVLNLARNSAKLVEQGFVRLRAESIGDGQLYIYVEDSGSGIPEETKTSLFAKFQESLDELSQGTGVGLSLCKKLIDLMDGQIELDSTYHSGVEGKPGAKFCIHFLGGLRPNCSMYSDASLSSLACSCRRFD
jgi:signal transduction histidine kinase